MREEFTSQEMHEAEICMSIIENGDLVDEQGRDLLADEMDDDEADDPDEGESASFFYDGIGIETILRTQPHPDLVPGKVEPVIASWKTWIASPGAIQDRHYPPDYGRIDQFRGLRAEVADGTIYWSAATGRWQREPLGES